MNDYPFPVNITISTEDWFDWYNEDSCIIRNWLVDNNVDYYSLENNNNFPKAISTVSLKYRFKNNTDAIAFKLRFG